MAERLESTRRLKREGPPSDTDESAPDAKKACSSESVHRRIPEEIDFYNPEKEYKDVEDEQVDINFVKEFFQKEAEKEFLELNRKYGDRKIEQLEDVLKLFHLRRLTPKCCASAEKYVLPIKSLKWITGDSNIKIQITDYQNNTVEIKYWPGEDCSLAEYGIGNPPVTVDTVEFNQLAAADFVFILKGPNLRLQLMEFDIEPFDKLPTFECFIENFLNQELRKQQVHVAKLAYKFSSSAPDITYRTIQQYLAPKVLTYLKFSVWKDPDESVESPRIDYSDFVEFVQWKQATHLEIQETNLGLDWQHFYHFEVISLESLDPEDVEYMCQTFKEARYQPTKGITINVERKLDFEGIKSKLEGIGNIDDSEKSIEFLSGDKKMIVKFEDFYIMVNVLET
ncbi:hypothetical protein L5515_010310 [Caenorhabditis briggsae]|nr:hypothetical protein L5515_010310 [Caenorhabditis briggsae]